VTLAELQGWILFWSDRSGQDAVFAMQPDSGEVIALPNRRLYNEAADKEVVHPGGLWRLEVRDSEGNADIWRVGQDSDFRLTSNEADDYDPAWAPNGQQIAFVSGRFGSDDVFIITGDLQGELRLTYYTGFDKHPSWSPDGSHIAFWSDQEGGRKQIWMVRLADASLTNLSNSPYNDWDPVWVK
jgi:Tol biopolymer transport system component